ncbi:MAG: ABC transporter permease [Pyrinomonadaceae bacterium]
MSNAGKIGSLGRMVSCFALGIFAAIVLLGDFIAPYDHALQSRSEPAAPPTRIHIVDESGEVRWPFIYRRSLVDPLARTFEDDRSESYDLTLFAIGDPYYLLGVVPARIHLFGVDQKGTGTPRVYLLGTDELGRDRFSRIIIATKFSLIVCPLGAILAGLIGVVIGLLSGYTNRTVDTILMGIADTMLSLPALMIILTARAAFPLELPPVRAAGLLVMIFALTGWAEFARLMRGLARSLKEREFVLAARSLGLTEIRIMVRHILPNALPTMLTQVLVMLPYFLLAEVALSFLGVGLQEPYPSLGNLLASAADINRLQREPLLVLAPGFVIATFVLTIRGLGAKSERVA